MTEILKYTVPALVVLATAWVILRQLLREERERRAYAIRREDRRQTVPIRLRGYERLTLLLERMTPEHILLDMDIAGMTRETLQRHLLEHIRQEFDHNLSQQIYVSDEVWQSVVLAKEETLNFVNSIAYQMPSEASALDYAQTLITAYHTNGDTPIEQALTLLKQEAAGLL